MIVGLKILVDLLVSARAHLLFMDVLYICNLYRLIERLKFLDHAMQNPIDIPAILELKLENVTGPEKTSLICT